MTLLRRERGDRNRQRKKDTSVQKRQAGLLEPSSLLEALEAPAVNKTLETQHFFGNPLGTPCFHAGLLDPRVVMDEICQAKRREKEVLMA